MRDPQDDAVFMAFAVATGTPLLRTAWLLTGDPQTAEDLVRGTLGTAYAGWPRLLESADPRADVRRLLVTAYLRGRRPRRRGRTTWRRPRAGGAGDAGAAGAAGDPERGHAPVPRPAPGEHANGAGAALRRCTRRGGPRRGGGRAHDGLPPPRRPGRGGRGAARAARAARPRAAGGRAGRPAGRPRRRPPAGRCPGWRSRPAARAGARGGRARRPARRRRDSPGLRLASLAGPPAGAAAPQPSGSSALPAGPPPVLPAVVPVDRSPAAVELVDWLGVAGATYGFLQNCLIGSGIEIRVHPDGSYTTTSQPGGDAQDAALVESCFDRVSSTVPLSEDGRELLLSDWTDTYLCLVVRGWVDARQPPSDLTLEHGLLAWNPYEGIAPTELAPVRAACPVRTY